MDVAAWLRSLDLGEYAPAFRENRIDEKVLPKLTADDLKELGVAALGHRRTLLDAIAVLRADIGAKSLTEETIPGPGVASVPVEDRAERRQVTVMFSDLVGSTALAARLDPEDMREIIVAYQNCVAATVRRFSGYVAKYLGDGVLIYFGYPQAHEDDAERAVRGGLEIITAVGALKAPETLKTRVGIATGVVVVGDLIGSGASQEQGIVGETPNLAARLQGIAEPNTVVIADSTRKLIGNLFELEDLGTKDLKGISGQVRSYAALRPATVESRFEALHADGLTDLFGREEELELILRRWAKTKSGEGQVVLLCGEPGIGKSRLTAAVMEGLAGEQHIRLRYHCSPQATDSAFFPIIGHMQRAAGFLHDDPAQTKLDKLDALLAQTATTKQEAVLFADLLSLPNDGRYPALDLPPQQRREKTLAALDAQLDALARQKPVLMIFEDAHWSDPTSLEAFGRVVDWIARSRAMLIVTYRPEFAPPWTGQPQVTTLTLNRLTQHGIRAIIERLVGNRGLPDDIRRDIIERTDGIPLFVEEMTKAVLEAGSEGAAAQAISMAPAPAIAVPASLHASLMARLDRLGPAKEIAQIGAAIGREFSYRLLAAVAGRPTAQLNDALDQLVESGLLLRQGTPPDATYVFKHALVQDSAYSTLLRQPRRALHARIADALESQFTEITETRPELVARQCNDAGLIEKAAGLWGKAGQRSLERSALIEAVALFTRALDQVAALSSTPALRREQIKFQVGLANALYHAKGIAATETRAAFDKARAMIEHAEGLGEHVEDPLLLYSVLYGFFIAKFISFDGDAASALAQQFLTLAERQKATAPIMVGHRLLGMTLLCKGDATEALSHLNNAWALYDPVAHRPLATRFGHDVGAATLTFRPLVQWLLGYPNVALGETGNAIICARETNHMPTLLFALACTAFTHICCRDHEVAVMHLDECIALAEGKVPFFKMFAGAQRGCVLALTGKSADAIQAISAETGGLRAIGATTWSPYWLAHLALAYAKLGKLEDARRCIGEAVTTAETTKEQWYVAEINRLAGEIALKSPDTDAAKAETFFERALVVAREQQAKSWELRAAMSLAYLWRNQGKNAEASEMLASVYGWFTEGFDTRDLMEAKALLADLAA